MNAPSALAGVCLILVTLAAPPPFCAGDDAVEVRVETPMAPPAWALLERELLRANASACASSSAATSTSAATCECVERWGGDDGPDDAIENVNDWPVLHALGAADSISAPVQEGLGRAPPPVHRGQDRRGAVRPRRDVLQGIPRHVRLAAQRRGADGLRPPGAVRPARPALPAARHAALPAST